MDTKEIYVKVTKDGPYLIYGIPKVSQKIILNGEESFPMNYGDGKIFEIKSDPIALCRCGQSKNAPFCDSSHESANFDGTQTASFDPILENAEKYEGPNLILMDNEKYCANARFCDAHGGIWKLVMIGQKDTDADALREANLCPAGRLVMFDKDGNMIEDALAQSIDVLEDEGLKISGPLWLCGGIRVESEDGRSYEIRNRQTLCRCGASKNKPFCDSAHSHKKYKANYKKEKEDS